jgi:hypothetical protein
MSRTEYQKKYQEKYAKTNKRFTVTLPIATYRDVEKQAKKWKMKPATCFREMALSSLNEQAFMPPHIEKDLKEISYLIRKISDNINQTAKHSNSLKTVLDDNDILQQIRALEESVMAYTSGELNRTKDDH